jgi:hypothetical protein
MKKILVLMFILLSYDCAFAGSEGGGGGDAVILPNGDVVLADIFLDRNGPQPANMPRRISLNPKLLLQLKIYGQFFTKVFEKTDIFVESSNNNEVNEIIKLLQVLGVRENDLVFYAVKDQDELNTYCASGGTKSYLLPDGAKVTQVACTSGVEVYLVESLFKKMNLLNQALLLIHERLTTLRDQFGGKNYGAIAGVTTGLGEILKQAYLQQNKKYNDLSESEKLNVHHFYEGLIELVYRNKEIPLTVLDWDIHKNGGGLVKRGAEVDESAFVGATSVITQSTSIAAKAIVVNSSFIGKIKIDEESSIINSSIKANRFSSGRGFSMSNSVIDIFSKDRPEELILNDNQQINKGLIKSNYNYYAPKGMKLNYPKISVPKTLTNCQKPFEHYRFSKVTDSDCFMTSKDVQAFWIFYLKIGYGVGGIAFTSNVELKQIEEHNGFWNSYNATIVLRSYSYDLSFSEIAIHEEETGYIPYTVYKGNLAERGLLRWRGFVYDQTYSQKKDNVYILDVGASIIAKSIMSELSLQNISYTHFPGRLMVEILIPVIE